MKPIFTLKLSQVLRDGSQIRQDMLMQGLNLVII